MYKCIQPCYKNGVKLMDINDIIVFKDNSIYNITRGLDCKSVEGIDWRSHVETITDSATISKVTVPKVTDSDKFKEIVTKMHETFVKKNHDYGNSFEESLDEEGIAASRIRIGDKWNRFKTLSRGKEILVKDESIKDTLLDMAVYSIMTIMWMDKQGL